MEVGDKIIFLKQEKILDKTEKQKVIDEIVKNLEINNQKDFIEFYNFLEGLNFEKLNILLKNVKIIKEEKIIFKEYFYYKLILKKTAEIGLELDKNHIKILKNNPAFYFRFIKGNKKNGGEKSLNINEIIIIVELFNKYNIEVPDNLLEKTLIINLDLKEIEEKLKSIKKYNIKKINTFFNNTLNTNIKFSENFLYNFDKLTKEEKFEYFLRNNYFLLEDLSKNPAKIEKNILVDNNIRVNLEKVFGKDFSFEYFLILDKKIDGRVAFSVNKYAFLPDFNISFFYNKLNGFGLYKNIGIEDFKKILLSNELVHSNLERIGFKKKYILDEKLKEVNNGLENYKNKNNIEIHEFLSDVGSISVNNEFIKQILLNLVYDNNLEFINGKIIFNGIPKNYPDYEYSYRFLMKLLNNIKVIKIINNKENKKSIFDKILKNLTEQDYNYIKQEYIKQGKIWINAIKK